jgi:hypothetical protein
MRRLAPLAAALALGAAPAVDTAPSEILRREMARVEGAMSASLEARRLLAATARLPRRARSGLERGDPIAFDARAGALVYDPEALKSVTELEAEVWLALALARAQLSFATPTVEAEQAVWTKVLTFCAERGAADPKGFGARLKAEAAQGQRRRAAAERASLPAEDPWSPATQPELVLPERALARAGLLVHLFESSPDEFLRAVERGTAWPPGTVRLSELEDLFALRGEELARLEAPPRGPYAALGGRRYPGALVRAAYRLRGTGEVELLRESLEAYDSVGVDRLKAELKAWRRAVGR